MTPIEKKILRFQIKMEKQTQNMKDQVYSICEKLDYVNSSLFSYNIDRISTLNKEIQEFNLRQKQ